MLVLFKKKILVLSVKCGPSYTMMIDYESTPCYFGVIKREKNLRRSFEMLSHNKTDIDRNYNLLKLFQFNSLCHIEKIYCGNQMVALIDVNGIVYLYSEKEGLNRIKIDMPIKSIKFIDSTIYALSKECDYVYEFTSRSDSKLLEDYFENLYLINLKYRKLNFIDTPYYDKALFFHLECTDKAKAMASTKQEKIFNLIKQRKVISTPSANATPTASFSQNDYCFRESKRYSLTSNNYSSSQSNVSRMTLVNKANNFNFNHIERSSSTIMSNLLITNKHRDNNSRINRISSLLGHIFDKKIEHIMTQSNSSSKFFSIKKKKIEMEKIIPLGVSNSNHKEDYLVTENISQRIHKRASSYSSRDFELTNDSSSKRRHMRTSSRDKFNNNNYNKILIKVNEEDACSESMTNDDYFSKLGNNKYDSNANDEKDIKNEKAKERNKPDKVVLIDNKNDSSNLCKGIRDIIDNRDQSNGNNLLVNQQIKGNYRYDDTNKEMKNERQKYSKEEENKVHENNQINDDTTQTKSNEVHERECKRIILTLNQEKEILSNENKKPNMANNEIEIIELDNNFAVVEKQKKKKSKEDIENINKDNGHFNEAKIEEYNNMNINKDYKQDCKSNKRNHTTKADIKMLLEKNIKINYYTQQKAYNETEGNATQKSDQFVLYRYNTRDEDKYYRTTTKRKIKKAQELTSQSNTQSNNTFENNKIFSKNKEKEGTIESYFDEGTKRADYLRSDMISNKPELFINRSLFNSPIEKINALFNNHIQSIQSDNILKDNLIRNNDKQELVQNNHGGLQLNSISIIETKNNDDKDCQNKISKPVTSPKTFIYKKASISDIQSFKITNEMSLPKPKETKTENAINTNNPKTIYQKPSQFSSTQMHKECNNLMQSQINEIIIQDTLNSKDLNDKSAKLTPQIIISDSIIPLHQQGHRNNNIHLISTSIKDCKEDSELKEALFAIDDITNNNSTKRQSQNEISSPYLHKKESDMSALIHSNKTNWSLYQIEHIALPNYCTGSNTKENNKPSNLQITSNLYHGLLIEKTSTENTDFAVKSNTIETIPKKKNSLIGKKHKLIIKNAINSNIMDKNNNINSHFKRSSSMALIRSITTKALLSTITFSNFNYHKQQELITNNHNRFYITKMANDLDKENNDNDGFNSINLCIDKLNPSSRRVRKKKSITIVSINTPTICNIGCNDQDIKTPIKLLNIFSTKKRSNYQCSSPNLFKKTKHHNTSMQSSIQDKVKHQNINKKQKKPKDQFKKPQSIVTHSTNHLHNKTNYSNTTSGKLNNTSELKEEPNDNENQKMQGHRRQKSLNAISPFTSSLTHDKPRLLTYNSFKRLEASNQIRSSNAKQSKRLQSSIERLREKYIGYTETGNDNNHHILKNHEEFKLNKVKEKIKIINEKQTVVVPESIRSISLIALEYDDKKIETSIYEPLELEKSNRSSFIGSQFDRSKVCLTDSTGNKSPIRNNTNNLVRHSLKQFEDTKKLFIQLTSKHDK